MSVPTTVVMAEPLWRPSPRARRLWALGAALIWLPVFVVQAVLGFFGWWPTWVHLTTAAVTSVLAGAHIAVVPFWRYHVHRWEISDTAVYVRTGWFTQERRIAPISRVQTVDTERGPLDRLLGLATVTVTTASSAGAVKITALDQDTADRTVARLTEIAGNHSGDAT